MQKGLEAQGNPELNNIREREKKKRCPQLQSFYQQRPERERKKKSQNDNQFDLSVIFPNINSYHIP